MNRFRTAFWIMAFGLIVSGCASDGKMESSSTSGGEAVVSNSTTSAGEATSDGKAVVSGPTNQSNRARIWTVSRQEP